MNTVQQGILTLIKSAITDEAAELPEQFDIEQAYPVMRRHSVLAMGYAGALKCGISKDCPAMQRLRQDYFAAVVKSEGQMAAIRTIQKAFDEAGIDYMLLKGSNLKLLYPAHEYRTMGDADILIRVEQYDKIRPLMLQLGYTEHMESDHELVWNSKALHLELHKRLVPTNNRDYYRYYGEGWDRAVAGSGSSYAMKTEDEFIYLFTHFAKHYRGSGVGLRQLMDLWVYRRSYAQLDEEYIRAELEKLALLEFYDNICLLLGCWFAEEAPNEKVEFIAQVIFSNGNWGTAKSQLMSEMLEKDAENGKNTWILQKVFLPRELLQLQYPLLKKWPVLLPACWIARWGKILLLKRKKLKWSVNILSGISVEDMQSFEQALEYVGLRFEK